MGVVPRVQSKLSRALHAHRGKKLLQDLQTQESSAMKRAMVRFRGAREKGAMEFVECLRVSQEDTMEGPLWRETLGRSLGSHDAAELVGGICHGSGRRQETTRLHAISCTKTGWSSLTHNRVPGALFGNQPRLENKALLLNITITNPCVGSNLGNATHHVGKHLADAVKRKKNKYRGSFPATYSLLPVPVVRLAQTSIPSSRARHQTGRAHVGDTLQRVPTSGGRDGSSASSAAILFFLQQALSFHTRRHLCRQRVAIASTRQLRSQCPVSVQAHRTEGVTGSEGQKGTNGVGVGIGVGGGNGDGNGVGGGNRDGDGAGGGTGTGVEMNKGAQDGNRDGTGDRSGDGGGDP